MANIDNKAYKAIKITFKASKAINVTKASKAANVAKGSQSYQAKNIFLKINSIVYILPPCTCTLNCLPSIFSPINSFQVNQHLKLSILTSIQH